MKISEKGPKTKAKRAHIIIVPSADKFITPLFSDIVSPNTAIIKGVLKAITVIKEFSIVIILLAPLKIYLIFFSLN